MHTFTHADVRGARPLDLRLEARPLAPIRPAWPGPARPGLARTGPARARLGLALFASSQHGPAGPARARPWPPPEGGWGREMFRQVRLPWAARTETASLSCVMKDTELEKL